MSNPFCYVELHTDALKEALSFYKKVFDWKTSEVPGMGGYHTFTPKKGVGGGLGAKQDPAAPNHWLAYVQVDDVRKTMTKAEKLGAKPVLPFMVLPNMGSIGIFIDPSGAALGVWAPSPPEKKPKKDKADKKAKREAKALEKARLKAEKKAKKDAAAEKKAKPEKAEKKAEGAKKPEKKPEKKPAKKTKPARKPAKKAS